MARLGIIVAVSEYSGSPKNLPACERDGEAIKAVLGSTSRFDEILVLSGRAETASHSVKNRLSDLADKHRGSEIEEVVFYFSGHGDYDGTDFLFLLSDYDPRRKNSTSLMNSELDAILRSLNPTLFVKIVDACHSGVSYIKQDSGFEDYVKSSNDRFQSVYFMFSSQVDEASYASSQMSYFTLSIVSAVVNAAPGPVRYRDIMSAVSDDFELSGGQRPQFVSQATNTEIFCESSLELKQSLRAFMPPAPVGSSAGKSTTLKDRILAVEKDFCTREEAALILKDISKHISEASLDSQISEFYTLELEEIDKVPPTCRSIGTWIKEEGVPELFAEPVIKSEAYYTKVPVDSLRKLGSISLALTGGGMDDKDVKTVRREREIVTGYTVTASGLPYTFLKVWLNPEIKVVPPVECQVAPLLSRNRLFLFYRFRRFVYVDWDETRLGSSTSWARVEAALNNTNSRRDALDRILKGYMEFVLEPLLEQFPEPKPVNGGTAEPVVPAEAPK